MTVAEPQGILAPLVAFQTVSGGLAVALAVEAWKRSSWAAGGVAFLLGVTAVFTQKIALRFPIIGGYLADIGGSGITYWVVMVAVIAIWYVRGYVSNIALTQGARDATLALKGNTPPNLTTLHVDPDVPKLREELEAVRKEVDGIVINLMQLPEVQGSIDKLKDEIRSFAATLDVEANERKNLEAALHGGLTVLLEQNGKLNQNHDRLVLLLSCILRIPAKVRVIRQIYAKVELQLEAGPEFFEPEIWREYQESWNGFKGLMVEDREVLERTYELTRNIPPPNAAEAAYSDATGLPVYKIIEARILQPRLEELEDQIVTAYADQISRLMGDPVAVG